MPAEADSATLANEKSAVTENVKDNGHKSPIKEKPDSANKHHRKRKRKYFNSIRDQMEFYFGDANLSKDRYLKQLIDKDPYVPIEVFLTFNKMKALTTSVDEIAKSLVNSQLLELDESQQKVRRKTALPIERDVDDKTLYVESLPPTADHDWVKQIFSRFGNVTYVSLPKYAKSRKIKEFGFIEFEKQESVVKAVKEFQEFKGVLSMQETDPAELKSVKAFIREQQNEEMPDEDEASGKEKKAKKRKPEELDSVENPKPKKPKTSDDEESAANTASDDDSSDTGEEPANEAEDAEQTDEGTKKKRRKKKKKSKKLSVQKRRQLEQDTDATYYDLKILPKRDWKRLRNKYLNLQREKVAELKRKAWKGAHHPSREHLSEGTENNSTASPAKKSKPSDRKLAKMNMNFYGAGDADVNEPATKMFVDKEIKQNPALERTPLFTYEPGLIVEVTFLEPCVTVKEFKADMRQYQSVKYVDVKEGAMDAHLRIESSDAAEEFVKQVNCAEYKCKVLTGEAETEYWRKIEQDREMKLNKKVKVPQKRGREKVKKLVTKHIRFGDDNED